MSKVNISDVLCALVGEEVVIKATAFLLAGAGIAVLEKTVEKADTKPKNGKKHSKAEASEEAEDQSVKWADASVDEKKSLIKKYFKEGLTAAAIADTEGIALGTVYSFTSKHKLSRKH
jgi:DNA-directed RNA polymerase specialized sigma24 family protein